jgi:hypothetical protein
MHTHQQGLSQVNPAPLILSQKVNYASPSANDPLLVLLLPPAVYTARDIFFSTPRGVSRMCYLGESKLLASMNEEYPDDATKGH